MLFIGNKKIVSFLGEIIRGNNVAQAYMFSGPEETGKRTLAELFARALILGENLDLSSLKSVGDPNAHFRTDMKIVSPAVEEVKGVLKEKDISVADVRQAQQFLIPYPYLGRKKVLIIDNAHKMTTSAQNALLKIMEEPNSTSLIILVTHGSDAILGTLKSRSQMINFSLVRDDEIRVAFQDMMSLDDATLELGMGRPGRVKKFLEDPQIRIEMSEKLGLLEKANEVSFVERVQLAESLAKNVPDTIDILKVLIWRIRKNLCLKPGKNDVLKGYGMIKDIEECIEILMSTNSNPRITLEQFLLQLK